MTAFRINCAPKFGRVPQTPDLCVRAVSKFDRVQSKPVKKYFKFQSYDSLIFYIFIHIYVDNQIDTYINKEKEISKYKSGEQADRTNRLFHATHASTYHDPALEVRKVYGISFGLHRRRFMVHCGFLLRLIHCQDHIAFGVFIGPAGVRLIYDI